MAIESGSEERRDKEKERREKRKRREKKKKRERYVFLNLIYSLKPYGVWLKLIKQSYLRRVLKLPYFRA